MALISLRIFSLVLKMDMYICPMDLVFATNNAHKLEEVLAILHNQLHIKTLSDISYSSELPETTEQLPVTQSKKHKHFLMKPD